MAGTARSRRAVAELRRSLLAPRGVSAAAAGITAAVTRPAPPPICRIGKLRVAALIRALSRVYSRPAGSSELSWSNWLAGAVRSGENETAARLGSLADSSAPVVEVDLVPSELITGFAKAVHYSVGAGNGIWSFATTLYEAIL